MDFPVYVSLPRGREMQFCNLWSCSACQSQLQSTGRAVKCFFKKEVYYKKVAHSVSPVCVLVMLYGHDKGGKSKFKITKKNRQIQTKLWHSLWLKVDMEHEITLQTEGFFLLSMHYKILNILNKQTNKKNNSKNSDQSVIIWLHFVVCHITPHMPPVPDLLTSVDSWHLCCG